MNLKDLNNFMNLIQDYETSRNKQLIQIIDDNALKVSRTQVIIK